MNDNATRSILNYTTADFSPIFPPEIKPDKVGWYASKHKLELRELTDMHSGKDTGGMGFWWFNGKTFGTASGYPAAYGQERYWFGLNRKP
jgi:hypothetical protein